MVLSQEELEKFKKTVEVFKELLQQNKAIIITSYLPLPFEARVPIHIIDDASLKSLLAKKGLSLEDFTQLLRDDVSRLLSVCLDERQKNYIEDSIRRWREQKYDEGRIESEKKELEHKLNLVGEGVSLRFKESWDFKKHAKTSFFSDITWDVMVKRFDSESEVKLPAVLATCQITYGTGSSRLLENRDSTEINFTESDVDFLVGVLSIVKEKIQSIRKEGGWQ